MNLLVISNFYPVIYCIQRRRRIIVYGLVTRYGPQSVVNLLCWNNVSRMSRIFRPKLQYFLSFKYIEI